MLRRLPLLVVIWLLLGIGTVAASPMQQQDDSTTDDLRVTEVLPAPNTSGVQHDTTLVVVFNRPVVPLGTNLQAQDLPNPLMIRPEVEGEGRWLNTAIYTFEPEPAWGAGLTYGVTVNSNLEAVDGATLAEPFRWSFTTQRAEVVETMPEPGAGSVSPEASIQMTFNTVMDQASLEDNFFLRPGNAPSQTVSGTFEWNDDGTGARFIPDEQLTLNTTYRAGFPGGAVTGVAGGEGLRDYTWSFTTQPLPAVISTDPSAGTTGVPPGSGVVIFFNAPMNPDSFDGLISVEPEPELEPELYWQEWQNGLRVSFDLEASTDYTINLDSGATDNYGNAIQQPFSFGFSTAPYSPDVSLQVPGPVGFYNGDREETQLFVTHRNISQLDLELYDLDMRRFATAAMGERYYDPTSEIAPEQGELLRRWQVEAQAEQNVRRYEMLSLGQTGASGQPASDCPDAPTSRLKVGDTAVVLTEPDPLRARSQPVDGEIVELLYRDYTLPIIGGPRCANGLLWWEVRLRNDERAWVAEGTQDEYFLELRTPGGVTPVEVTPEAFTEGESLEPGLYYLTVSAPELSQNQQQPRRHVMVVGTANLVTKMSTDSMTVWATDVQTGEPIANAPITIYDQNYNVVTQVSTDADGVAQANVPDVSDLYVQHMAVMDTDEHFGIGLTGWSNGIDPWRFGLSSAYYPQNRQTYLYTDRPIYRPGQPVYFRGVIRDKDGVRYTPIQRETIPIEIYDNENEIIYEETLPLTEYSTFSGEFMLADDAMLGSYRIEVALEGEDRYRNTGSQLGFRVAEYRVPEFQVAVTPREPAVVQGDTIQVDVKSTYFFGGDVQNADVEYNVVASPYRFEYEGDQYYDFTDYDPDAGPGEIYGSSQGRVASGTGTTDEDGEFTIEVPADLEDATQSQTFTIEAVVSDESERTVAGRAEVIVHQGELYVGARAENYVNTANQQTNLEVIAVDWDSESISGQEVDVEVVERRWSNVQEKDPNTGRTVWNWEVEEIPVDSDTVTTGEDGTATYTFVPPNGGVFKATFTTQDDSGNTVTSSTTTWVSSREYVSWRQQNSNRIDLVTDAQEYEVGDTAEVLITSPFQGEAEALVTVEREGVLKVDRVTMDNNSYVYELPIEPDYAPNVFVSVVLVKGVDENNPVAAFRMGVAELQVNNERKQINIDIQPDTERAGPGDTVQYTVRTTDYQGDPVQAEVGVGLTDLASLSIASPNSGPILDAFYAVQNLTVRTATALTINTDQLTQTVLDTVKGGGGGGAAAEGGVFDIREEFVDTAFWQPDLTTGEDGEATFEVTLPDNLTTWRLDARAVTRGEDGNMLVGQETFDLLSTKPLLVRPVTPRFFIVDDEVVLAAVVNNNTESTQQVTVTLEGSGFSLQGDAAQDVTISAGGSQRVEWPVTVNEVQNVDLNVFARSQDDQYTDASKPPLGQGDDNLLPVYRYEAPETVGTGGTLEESGTRTEEVLVPDGVTQGELDVNVEPSLAASMLQGLDALESYPYEHIEATVSRFLPNVLTLRALEAAGVENPDLRAEIEREVELALQRLAANQKVNGSWGWYSGGDGDPLVTAYALIGLVTAQQNGFTVDQALIDRTMNYLPTTYVTVNAGTENWRLNRQAFILYAMAYAGAPDVSRTVNLYEARNRLMLYPRAMLINTFEIIGGNDARIDVLVSDLTNAAITSANGTHWEEDTRDYWNWNTDTRTTSLVLDALVNVRPDSALIPNVVRWLMVNRAGDGWETTQETAWAVMALTDWLTASEELNADYDWSLLFNDEEQVSGSISRDNVDETRALTIDVADMLVGEANTLQLERSEGPGTLYYTAYLRNFLPVPEIEPLNNGIVLERRYTLLDDSDNESINSAQVGEVVQVRLTIVAPNDLHYVTIEDPIPAGVEPIDTSLETSQQVGTGPDVESPSNGWGLWYFDSIQFRDEKVVLSSSFLPAGSYEFVYTFRAGLEGTYNVIPPTGNETYFPDVYGRGAGSSFTVEPAED